MTGRGQFTVGVEEEYFIVDRETRAPRPDAEDLLARARERLGDQVHAELQLAQLEVSSAVCHTLAELRRDLIRLRQGVGTVAEDAGASIAAAGTHPFASWPEHGRITPSEPYLALERDYQQLAREQLICGCHVHVGIEDPEMAIQVLNRVRPWLSPLVALAANSPFWRGVDTGYASYRTEVWRRWPMAGTPEIFADRSEYDRLLDTLLATRSVDAPARVYFDVRPSARFATLEFRVTDVCMTVDEAVMVAGLVRGLAATCATQAAAGEPVLRPRAELLRAASWRAARHGADAELLDVPAERTAPASEVVDGLLAFVRPALDDTDDWAEVSSLVAATLHRGTGAARQRRMYAETGRLADVVDLVVAHTAL